MALFGEVDVHVHVRLGQIRALVDTVRSVLSVLAAPSVVVIPALGELLARELVTVGGTAEEREVFLEVWLTVVRERIAMMQRAELERLQAIAAADGTRH